MPTIRRYRLPPLTSGLGARLSLRVLLDTLESFGVRMWDEEGEKWVDSDDLPMGVSCAVDGGQGTVYYVRKTREGTWREMNRQERGLNLRGTGKRRVGGY